jgi:hypothetical protein
MKLKEFLEVAVLSKKNTLNLINPTFVDETCLYGEELDKYKNIIKECDEFAKCDSLEILTMPLVKGKNGEIYTPNTIKLSDLMEFKGKCYLLSLALTPEMYDPSQLIKPVKNGAAIGPVIYDPMSFEPRKHILLTWIPEMVQDILGLDTEKEQRQVIHKLLDDVLDNPEEYKTNGNRHVLVRGLFEVIENGNDVVRNEYDVDLTKNETEEVGCTVFYLETNVVKPGEVNLEIKSKIIPPHLRRQFIDEYGDNPRLITLEIIDEFLKRQEEISIKGKQLISESLRDVYAPINETPGDRLRRILTKNKVLEDRLYEFENYGKKVNSDMKKYKQTKK